MCRPYTLWISRSKSHVVWPWTRTAGKRGLVENQMSQIDDNLLPLRFFSGDFSLLSSPGHAVQSEWHDIKALPHQDWKAYIHFCLQAVNYLTSTHNEQCKTSQNLIKKAETGPIADGKWLTQLIKHPSVRLNMQRDYPIIWNIDGIHCTFQFFYCLFASGTFAALVMLTPVCSVVFMGIYMTIAAEGWFPVGLVEKKNMKAA